MAGAALHSAQRTAAGFPLIERITAVAMVPNVAAQLVPCTGPFGSSEPWASHGEYVSVVIPTAQAFVD
jgi:hypothetical protein